MLNISTKLRSIPPYAFDEMNKIVAQLAAEGVDVIDFGTGDPRDETPDFIRNAAKAAIDSHKTSGYPSYIGMKKFRDTVAQWYQRRFKVALDPETEITSTIGSKEGIFNFQQAFLETGDYVLMPSPGYPPYFSGTIFAGGIPYRYPLLAENNLFPDFSKIPDEIAKKAKIFWLCYPNSPTGKLATVKLFEQSLEFCQKHNIILASDECYIDLYFREKTISALEVGKKGVIAFHSLSKRNNMTGYRVGFACGDPEIITVFKKLKTNIDSGTSSFMQEAAIAALNDDTHVQLMREKYQQRKDLMVAAFKKSGLQIDEPEGTFYIWQRVPSGHDSVSFAKRLLEKDCAIAVTPGQWLSDTCDNGVNPGDNYVRLALVESAERVAEAAERISKLKL